MDAVFHTIEDDPVDTARCDPAFADGPPEQAEVRDDFRPLVFRSLRCSLNCTMGAAPY